MRASIGSLSIVFALAALPAAGPAWSQGKEHPTLPDPATAQCDLCHEDLFKNRAVIHAPAQQDCSICHQFSTQSDGMRVALIEAEPELCLLCHDDQTRAAHLELEVPHFPVGDSCLTCHDPHAAENQRLLAAPTVELCGQCHERAELSEPHGGQITAATDCARCHQPHGSDNQRMLRATNLHRPFADGSCKGCHRQPFGDRVRLTARGSRLCTACHPQSDATEAISAHRALADEGGRAGCLSCHDPHMSDHPKTLVEAEPALCSRCHGEVVAAAQADTGHYAAADSCLTCHRPHTSDQPRLLNQPAGELCVFCHDATDADLVAAHLGAEVAKLDCIQCHTPHGSGNPSLLARNLHAPVEDGCDLCHEGSYDQLAEGGPPELCVLCHDEIAAAAAAATVSHGAMEVGSCTDCHNPHASPQEKLVKAPGAGPCAECHEEQVAGPGEVEHGIIGLVGCRACHEPHGGANEKLLRRTGAELCLSCHGAGRVRPADDKGMVALLDGVEVESARLARGSLPVLRLSADGQSDHPVTNHRVVGVPTPKEIKYAKVSFEGELTCITCHDPHKGRSAELFRWDAASPSEACQVCHRK